jgi:uncharacterized protein YjdB
MSSIKRKLQLAAGLTALLALALAVGCRGFFVNPQLTTITVGPPNANIQQGSNLQMSATGTYDDNSHKTLTSGLFWSTSNGNIASVGQNNGVVLGASPGTATITASQGAVSGSTSITVSLVGVTAIAISPKNTTGVLGQQIPYTVTATVQGGGTADVTSSCTFTLSDTSGNITILTQQSPALLTIGNNTTHPETVMITANYVSGTNTLHDTATLMVQ